MRAIFLLVLVAAPALAEPTGQRQTLRAERERVEQLRDDMGAILERVPGGRGVAEQLRAERSRKTGEFLDELAAKAASAAQPERDPFAVTPQLRAGAAPRSPGYIKAMPGAPVGEAPLMSIRALVGEPGRRVALIQLKDVGLVRVREGATFQLPGNQAYRVKAIRDDAVVLESGHAEAEFLVVR